MSIILSLSEYEGTIWAAGPYGLFAVGEEELTPTPQPQERLTAACSLGDRIFTGGAPFGVAYLLDTAEQWQAAWQEGAESAVLTFASSPDYDDSGVILAGSEGDGVLRTRDRGLRWMPSNFGLRNLTVLTLAWAPPMQEDAWPRWQVVFAGTEEGIYRSPNAGLGWKRSSSADAAYQTVAVAPDVHCSGLVLAGTEEGGLWRSTDGGRTFAAVDGAPEQVNSLVALVNGDGSSANWLLSDDTQLWSSQDGAAWTPVAGSAPALCMLEVDGSVYVGGENGVTVVDGASLQVERQLQIPAM
ncbi:MAG: hypothetical protein F4X14_12330 [Caldilineaceae bacterium SB0661_bin_32]|uniref:Exo-alpha-sialidase n=1 Tax=Caldilineaceae bacterium SB0661_bin_32 TaxID=2605255 RepID=A0A6B1D827_9CHLR|nr:hypothetical protein [Caldilineaceae bacterium SB0661_bin_32]